MRRLTPLLISVALAVLTACADSQHPPTVPDATNPAGPQFGPPAVPNPYCSPTSSDAIEAELHDLFVKNNWPDENSVRGKFELVQARLLSGDITGAQQAAKNLVDFITNKFDHLGPGDQAAAQALYDQTITDIWCYVGISGSVFDLNPGDPEKAFDVPDVGGVDFPPDVVPVGTLVSITDISNQGCPLFTVLDCFPGFLSISLYPNTTLPQPAVVVLCTSSAIPPNVMVGHQDPTVGFEILTPSPVPALLGGTCTGSSAHRAGPDGWLARVVDDAVGLLLPQPLQAAPLMFLGGIGGVTSKFSPFGIVSTTVTGTGGLGGKTSSFVPSASTGPSAGPPSNPPLPATYVQGAVGTNATTGLPFVTIMTAGGDADGSNPVPGVTVTFTTGASQLYDPDSGAKVCDALGTVPASGQIQVITDPSGVATLPCIAFGTVAGFANLSATFDPSTLNFPNANLVTIVADDGTSSGSSLNWLVKSNAGLPTVLGIVTAPSGSAQAGVPLTQQPSFQLFDGLGNEVWTGGIDVTVTVTSGGGTATYTAPVTTDPNGVATFTDLAIGGAVAGIDQTLSFSFTGIAQPLTAVVQLSAGPASQLVITGQPSTTAEAGVAFPSQPSVTIEDQYGNVVNSAASVDAGIATGAGTLAGTTSVAAVGGVATFTDLRIDGLTGDRTLSFTSGLLASAASNPIAVGAGPTSQVVILTQPSATAQAGVAFSTQPVVAIQDQFGNQTNSTASVVASIAAGAGSLAGTTSIPAVGGAATFTDLRIDGLVGSRTLAFTAGAFTSPPTSAINVGAGPAFRIFTLMNGVQAQEYTYPGTLAAFSTVSPAPQVIVKDAFGNPVPNRPVFWYASSINGGVLTVGATGTPTDAAGTAQVASWLLGNGSNQTTVGLFSSGVTPTIPGYLDALFNATTPIGTTVFSCSAGTANSKTDLGPLSIKAPNGTTKRITLRMSITGTSQSPSNYDATLEARLGSLTGTLLGTTTGKVQLPGNNGNATPITFTFPTAIPKQTSRIWFKLTIAAPANRKPQVWYQNANWKTNDPCYDALAYAPGSTTVFKRGLSIIVTN